MLMLYMVQGYLFLAVYNFICFKQNELNHLFFKSIVGSYVLKILFDFLFIKNTTVEGNVIKLIRILNIEYESMGYCLLLLLFSVILGILVAYITQSKWFNNLLLKTGIKRTTNPNIWDDIIEPNCWLMVYLSSSELVYFGQFKYSEEFAVKPIIVLERYQIIDMDGNIKSDYSNNPSEVAVIDTKNIERIEITYQ